MQHRAKIYDGAPTLWELAQAALKTVREGIQEAVKVVVEWGRAIIDNIVAGIARLWRTAVEQILHTPSQREAKRRRRIVAALNRVVRTA